MNIAIISDFNIGGQPTALWRAINKYTSHHARCIIANDDHFQYDRDIILNSPQAKEEAANWCKKADFFHFGRSIFNWAGIDFNSLLNKNNCCVKYYGSELRQNWRVLQGIHAVHGIAAITGTDWTITGLLPNSFYHLGSYFTKFGDMAPDEIPWRAHPRDVGLRICAGSAGSPLKGYNVLNQVVDEIRAEGEKDLGLGFISGVSNRECLERKQFFNCTFTSLHGGWGISGVESMFLGHAVIGCLDPWVLSLYPDQPTVIVSKDNLRPTLKWLVGDLDRVAKIGEDCRRFAIANFNTKTILKRYLYLIDLIMNREGYLQGGQPPKNIYDF